MSSIALRAKKCAGLFEDLIELLRQPGHRAYEISDTETNDAFGRFKIWAGNIGAFQQIDLKSSLDFRLRNAAKISTQILENLDDLTESLEDACSIVSNARENRKGHSLTQVEQSEDEQEETEELSEIREIFESIQDAINSLFRYSIIIRNNTNRDRYAKAAASAINSPFNDEYDIQHVRHKFPALQSKNYEWLIERLGKAITQRRQYLRYCLSHHEKMCQEPVLRAAPEIFRSDESKPQVPARLMPSSRSDFSKPTSTLAPTQASTLLLTADQAIEEEVAEEAPSQTSYATSTDEESSSHSLRVIPLEDVSRGLGHFECPYCWQIQTCRTQKAWKKHVLSDLKPYVCTFEDCELKLFSDRQTWFSHELKNHRKEWKCHFCAHYPFDQLDSYRAHLSTRHPQSFTTDHLTALFEISQKPVLKLSPTDCPFCDDWEDRLRAVNKHIPKEESLVVTPSQFRHHVGAHMVQLALFAIPRGYTEEGDADSAVAVPHIDSDNSSLGDDPPDLVSHEAMTFEQFRKCEDILDGVIKIAQDDPLYNDALQFQFPTFSLRVPGFGFVKVSPMDLAMISQKLQSGFYSNNNDFSRDLVLFVALCRARWPFFTWHEDLVEKAVNDFLADLEKANDLLIFSTTKKIQWMLWKAYQLDTKPASRAEICPLNILLDSGITISRVFLKSDPFEDIYATVECYELISGGLALPKVPKPVEYLHSYNFRLIDSNTLTPDGALVLRDCTVGYIVETYRTHDLVVRALQDEEPPLGLSDNGEVVSTRWPTIERKSSPGMEQSSHPNFRIKDLRMPTKEQCLDLTDEQCRQIKVLVDPYPRPPNENWELEYQPELIRLYMTGASFLKIESSMTPRLTWSFQTYRNRFRGWNFPIDPEKRKDKIMELFALVSYSGGEPETLATRLLQMRNQVRTKDHWELDKIVKSCPSCGDSFSVLRRKHHCTICGRIFDSKCLNKVGGQKLGFEDKLIVCGACLGTLERFPGPQIQAEILVEDGPSRQAIDEPPPEASSSRQPRLGSLLYAPVFAKISRFCFAKDKYWFIIHADLEDGKTWELSRYYEDFYDLQIALLTKFPAEAGNTGTQKRTLPYMPGPVNLPTEAITEGRMHNLNTYLQHLLEQPAYISQCNLVKQFFAPREFDCELSPEKATSAKGEMFSKDSLEERNATSGRSIKIHDHHTLGSDEDSSQASEASW